MTDETVPPRVLAAESRRRLRRLLEDGPLGCPFDPPCGAMLVDHPKDGYDGRGDAINPRCPDA